MASSSSSSSRISSHSIDECRPKLLKDFLTDDSMPSCSSIGFNPHPLKSSKTSSHSQLLRTRSKATTISVSAIHKASEMVINAIKFFPFASIVKAPSILPRSISRKLSRRNKNCKIPVLEEVSVVTPKIKDILRWKSFRDVVEEISTSWFEQDFTPEELSSWGGENNDFMNHQKKLEGNCPFDENEQHSPVSILDDSPFRDDEGSVSLFNRSFSIMERRKCILMQRIQEFESLVKQEPHDQEGCSPIAENSLFEDEEAKNAVEAKATQLLSHVKATTFSAKNFEVDVEHLLLDFFRHELTINNTNRKQNDVELSDCEMLRSAKSWMSREYCEGSFDSEVLEKREACVKDMETGQKWNKFDEEQQEFGSELQIDILNDLFDELLVDLVTE